MVFFIFPATKIYPYGVSRFLPKVDYARLAAFPLSDKNIPTSLVDIFHVDGKELISPRTCIQEAEKDGYIPSAIKSIQMAGFFHLEYCLK